MSAGYKIKAQQRAEEVRKLRKVLREMLECYWGDYDDGDVPPEFIRRAATLSGWKIPYPNKGKKTVIGTPPHTI